MGELQRMNRIFVWSLYALIALPFVMTAIGGGVGPVMGTVFALGVAGSWFFTRRGYADRIGSGWWNAIIITFVAVTAGELLFFDTSILSAGIRLVLVLTLIKLFSRTSERDELQLLSLSFLLLAAATTVNEDVTFGVLFGVYVLIGTFTLAVFHLRSELGQRPRLALYGGIPLNGRYIAVLASISALILASSLSIFFVFPRLGLGFFAQQSRDGVSVTGFNEKVRLGDHGAVRDNPQVVMRVEFPDGRWPELGGIHWRTMTFDYYDGRSWSQTLPRGTDYLPPAPDDAGWDLTEVHPSKAAGPRLQIYLEPLGTNVLPVVWPSRALRLGTTQFVVPWGPRAGEVKVDAYGDLRHTIEAELGVAYLLTVGEETERVEHPGEPHPAFLQLPELSQRVETLAAEITVDETTVDDKAEAIERHLESNYTYTTDLPRVGDDPIDSFLFESKTGHCEYFATTMVLLLRTNDIPARLVNGFLGGRWNETGGYLAVRQGDAHSWVEYWSPELGWVPIDPTPPTESLPGNATIETLREIWDSMRLTWTKWVIEYDLNAQIEFFRRAADILRPEGLLGGDDDQRSVSATPERDNSDWRTALLIGGLATLAFFAYLRVRRRVRRHDRSLKTGSTALFFMSAGSLWMAWFQGFEVAQYLSGAAVVSVGVVVALFDPRSRRATSPVARTFEIVEDAAARVGLGRAASEGPEEFLGRLARACPGLADDLERFSAWYLRARFSGRETTPEQQDRLLAIARRVADGLREHRQRN